MERLLEDPSNVEALHTAQGSPHATLDELAAWLVSVLASRAFGLLKTRVNPPILDAAPETNLVDLRPPEQPRHALETLTFKVRDDPYEGVAVHYNVNALTGNAAGPCPQATDTWSADLGRQRMRTKG